MSWKAKCYRTGCAWELTLEPRSELEEEAKRHLRESCVGPVIALNLHVIPMGTYVVKVVHPDPWGGEPVVLGL